MIRAIGVARLTVGLPLQPTPKEKSVKKLRCIQRSAGRHWVGNGFPVRTLFAYPNLGSVLSPFLLLDYAGPLAFSPTDERRGVGEPIDEPIVGHGPFIMNIAQEIRQAMADYQSGKMGHLQRTWFERSEKGGSYWH